MAAAGATTDASSTKKRKQFRTPEVCPTYFYPDNAPLPRTLSDALTPTPRAIAVTESVFPYRIVSINPAWENLFGYSETESCGKTLGCFLQGSEVKQSITENLVQKLKAGQEEADTTLVNYSKCGRRFHDRVRAGPLYNEQNDELTHFVVVVQEVPEKEFF